MKIQLTDLIDIHSGKTAYVLGLGPSLKSNLSFIEEESKKKNCIFFCCNLYNKMTKIEADYWLKCNPEPEMQIATIADYINEFKGVFIYCRHCDQGRYDELISKETKFALMEDIGIPELCSEYCGETELPYKGVESVIVHLTALAIITGCKDIKIAGVDLNYHDNEGYVDGGKAYPNGVHNGKSIMKKNQYGEYAARESVVNDILSLREYSKKKGVFIECIDEDTYLSKKMKLSENPNV